MKRHTTFVLIALFMFTACKPKPAAELNIDAPYKHWIIYNLDVKTFQDSNGDGEGDFQGLTSRLDYLRGLGINTIWLAPFQPSPLEDDGYDVTDYCKIDPKLGNDADFQQFLKAAKAKGLNVIMDLALNHSSIRHPWFRSRPDWYLWSKSKPADWDKGMGFPGVEKDSWHFDPEAKAYYFHRFYRFEPDLNYQNPKVAAEAEHILGYWLDKGLDGFRLDAVPFVIDDPRKNAEKPDFDFELLHRLTGFVIHHKPGAVLLGEANVEPNENEKYFTGHHDGLQMMFNFYANQYLFYGLATGDAGLFKKALLETKTKPGIAQWAWFLRNHDEIDLGRLSHHQFNQVTSKMGPDTNMQLYKRGIRRRLAPMLGNNPRRLRLAYALLYGLPGTPVIRQGEEIGMGDNLSLKERLSVRTPMQWDSTDYAGFTSGSPFRPLITSSPYDYKTVNVKKESDNEQSLLAFVKQIILQRQKFKEFDNGEWRIVDSKDEVLALLYSDKGKRAFVCYNFSDKPQEFKSPAGIVKLPPYGFKWQKM
ncbi:alpha-amylase family protein [Mucilaginibacter aquaedulcis]|uniref:alpha-amylase family protein n=1 Tax=Mucilaginibacter aquaedulcis TaxID=1187081 RepID=UPI0025B5C6D2|nr:alpha-amylase family protein [Mucilaginibacter aquaedulcis]MDN3551158.1 alpha-amylase family protein [Mucilaginibacter aquaedulcis]